MNVDDFGDAAGGTLTRAHAARLDTGAALERVSTVSRRRSRTRIALAAAGSIAVVLVAVSLWWGHQPRLAPVLPGRSLPVITPDPSPARHNGPLFAEVGGDLVAYPDLNAPGVPVDDLESGAPHGYFGSMQWSPNGELLVYAAAHEIHAFDVVTHVDQVVAACRGCDIALAPDGRTLAMTEGPLLQVTDLDGSFRTTIAELPADYYTSDPTWAPDGASIAFVADNQRPSRRTIEVVSLDTGLRRTLVYGSALDSDGDDSLIRSPAWYPDSEQVLFLATSSAGSPLLMAVPRSGGEPTLVANPCPDDPCSNAVNQVTWSPDGRLLALSGGGSEVRIGSMPGRGSVPFADTGISPTYVGVAWQPVP